MRFEYSKLAEGLNGRIGVIDTTIPRGNDERIIATVDKETSARLLVDVLNELHGISEEKPLDLHHDFKEYDELISKMNKDARELFRLEKEYQNEFNRVLEEAIEHKVDFKALYGGNNASTRKQYVEEQLSDMLDEIQELKFCKTENQRQLDFLKRLIDMKIQLIRYEVK